MRNAREAIQRGETKILTAGYDKLSYISKLYWSAVKRNLLKLEAKLAIETIEEQDSSIKKGKTYRIFSMKEILIRHRKAGMTNVFRGKEVYYVYCPEVEHDELQQTVSSEALWEDTVSSQDTLTVSSQDTDTVSSEVGGTVSSEDTHIGSSRGKGQRTPPATPSRRSRT